MPMGWSPEMSSESRDSLHDFAAAGPLGETISREVVVANSQGLHARPAERLAREARRWQSRIELVADSQRVDGKSILDLLTLAAEAGTRLVVEATGPDAREALEAIGTLFDRNFNEHAGSQNT
jgi:phosphocarrier protein HPr